MSRLSIEDTIITTIAKFSGGNPGAIVTLKELFEKTGASFVIYAMILDEIELYEDKLYMLWNDCCDRKIDKVVKILDSVRDGKITQQDINERIKEVGYGKSFDDLLGE